MRNVVQRSTVLMVASFVLLVGSTAFAHPHHEIHQHASGEIHGFGAGLLHPLFGVDHLLAMLTVGVLAARTGHRGVWILPLAFLGSMTVGGAVGMSGRALIGVESGIALSVILLGVAVAIGRNQPLAFLFAACGLFGFYHGHAHGAEMPAMSQPMLYALGFVAATAALHLAGIGIGHFFAKTTTRQTALRLSGVAVALTGVALLLR
jgi:urease accessory protein